LKRTMKTSLDLFFAEKPCRTVRIPTIRNICTEKAHAISKANKPLELL
jgi:hypothetical protein